MRIQRKGGALGLVFALGLGCLFFHSFAQEVEFSDTDWKLGGEASVPHEIRGAGERNNPMRRELAEAFAGEVLPVLEQKCFKCHEGEGAKKGIRLDVLDEVLNWTAPRNHKASRLFEVVARGEMPPEGKGKPLTETELEVFRDWIDGGLVWAEKLLPTPVPETDHWAFQPIRRPEVPQVKRQDWVRTPVDAFIARKHEELGLEPAPEAVGAVLQRRAATA